MKLPHLLAHFLYQNKTLSLPGVGVFSLDPETPIPTEFEKDMPITIQGLKFQSKIIQKADPELISYLHEYTGKMKSLAESDLDSYLNLGIQLVNIGKPFYLEGIGSIFRNKEDKLDFEPGVFTQVKLILPSEEQADISDKWTSESDSPTSEKIGQPVSSKKIFIALGILGGLALITWGGYNLYKNKMLDNSNENNIALVKKDSIANANDSLHKLAIQTDSLNKINELRKMGLDSSKYKFIILATANKKRAEARYKQLFSFSTKVKMDTSDSSFFKVYFLIPAASKDTLHIKDSLNAYYATKTIIEK